MSGGSGRDAPLYGGAGIFGFPKDRCARILLDEAERFCRDRPDSALREIRFTLIDDETVGHFRREFERRWPASEERRGAG